MLVVQPWEKNMIRGYKDALRDAELKYDRRLDVETKSNDSKVVYKVLKEKIKRSVPFTAMIHVYGFFGMATVKALTEKGFSIPEDISLVCVGGNPEVTCIDYDVEGMGRVAAERLIEKLSYPDSPPERVVLEPRLIQDASVRMMKNK